MKTAKHTTTPPTAINRQPEYFFQKGRSEIHSSVPDPFFIRTGASVQTKANSDHPDLEFEKKSDGLTEPEISSELAPGDQIQPYRNKKSFNFGVADDPGIGIIEDSFLYKRDKNTKPWIEKITIKLTSKKTDSDGNSMWIGDATAQYFNNPVKKLDLSLTVSAGSREVGITDAGSFTVKRIEAIGYNSGSFSGTPGRDFKLSEREGPKKRYSKNLSGNMNFAVFYNKGEAIHSGPVDLSSHGCVHVDWSNETIIRQLNYHSVIGLTKVTVSYP
jgi:hypothetical protein